MQQSSPSRIWQNAVPRLGFVGLGNMGAALAMRLVGQPLSVFDADPEKSAAFTSDDVAVAASLQELAADSDIIFICLPTSAVT